MEKRIKKNMSVAEYADLVETWEEHRCSDGAEHVYDLQNKKDFRFMVRKHGFLAARNMRRQNRFWFDGFNYKEPVEFPKKPEIAYMLANAIVDDDLIAEMPELYEPFTE